MRKKIPIYSNKILHKMDIPQLATILSSTFDPNLREEAEKKLNEVKIAKLMLYVRMCVKSLLN